MSTIQHAQKELELAGMFDEDSDYNGMIGTAIMELIEVFSKQNHSGFSGPRVASLFKKLAVYECLMPLTGEDDEWNDISDLDKGTLQNKRVSSVFKEKETGKAYYLDAITWKTQKGGTWHGNALFDGEKVSSRQYIKKFPFTPKEFLISVWEKEISKDNWEFLIKDKEQLLEVSKYYDLPFKLIVD